MNHYSLFKTKIGTMGIGWSAEGILCTRLPEKSEAAMVRFLKGVLGQDAEEARAPQKVANIIRAIQDHLAGSPQKFSLHTLDLSRVPNFHRAVYEKAVGLKSGKILTYGELATLAGSPKAARAVGQSMAKNPFPIIVPCHRVFGAGQKLVGFSAFGGVDTKEKILAIEGFRKVDA